MEHLEKTPIPSHMKRRNDKSIPDYKRSKEDYFSSYTYATEHIVPQLLLKIYIDKFIILQKLVILVIFNTAFENSMYSNVGRAVFQDI